jgi:hypothetical protein
MKKKILAEDWSVYTLPEPYNPDDPYLPTGVDLEPEVHPRSEIQMNAKRIDARKIKLNAAARLASVLNNASIMPSNQAPDNDTHISSVDPSVEEAGTFGSEDWEVDDQEFQE